MNVIYLLIILNGATSSSRYTRSRNLFTFRSSFWLIRLHVLFSKVSYSKQIHKIKSNHIPVNTELYPWCAVQ
jgi:hypothetical protein